MIYVRYNNCSRISSGHDNRTSITDGFMRYFDEITGTVALFTPIFLMFTYEQGKISISLMKIYYVIVLLKQSINQP